jgi:hypothetical protein
MKIRIAAALGAGLLALGGSASANDTIADIAGQAGLSERQVRMAIGAPSAWAEYRTSYLRTKSALRARGLDERALAVIERHQREIDRAVEISMRYAVLPRPARELVASAD